MKSRADFGNGGKGGFVGAGEATEREADAMLRCLLDFIAFNAGWDESSGDGRIAGTIGEILARDGQVEREFVVGFSVDLDGVCSVHRLSVGEVSFVVPCAGGAGFGDHVSIVIGGCLVDVPSGNVIDAARGRKVGCRNATQVDCIADEGEGPEAFDGGTSASDGVDCSRSRMAGIEEMVRVIQANLS